MRKPSIRMLAVLVVLGSLAGCFSLFRGHGPVDGFQFLAARNPSLERNVTGSMNENADPVEITVVVPPSAGSLELVATFALSTEASIAVVSSGRLVPQQNGITRNDFSAPVMYSIQVPGDRQPWRYRVSVRYADTNAALSQIAIPEGYAMSPLFSPKVKSYTVEVPWSIRKVRIEARGQSRNMQDIAIDGAGSGGSSASATVDFASGLSRSVPIETLAEDGASRDAYTVTLKRLPADTNARLESLEIVGAPFFPAFSPTRPSYQVEVPFDTTSIVVKARAQSAYATLTLQTLSVVGRISSARTALPFRGNPADRAGATIDFANGTLLTVIVAVSAEDGGVQEYLIDVARAAPDRNNALADLVVEPGRMSPVFSSRVLAYVVEVPFSTRQLVIAARAQSTFAQMELVPGPVSSNTVAPPLKAKGAVGAKGGATVEFAIAERISLAVAVSAQDGRTQLYVLDVRRAPPDANADLGALTASAGVLSPIFSPRIISYAVSLSANVESVKLTATAASAVATVDAEGITSRPAATQSFTVMVAGGATETVNLIVTAEDGTQKLYRVRVSREAGVPPGQDTNTRLARMQLAGAQLWPAFRPDVLDYEANLAANVASVVLSAAAESPMAIVEVDGQPLSRSGRVIALEPGTVKTVLVDVRAENGEVARTILWLSRDRAGPGRDPNARLASLRLTGAQLAPAFDPLVLDYRARLAASVASVTLTAAAESPVATIEVDGQPLGRTGRVIALDPGTEKMVIIDVTAESGNVSSTILWLSRDRVGPGKDTNARLASLRLLGTQLSPGFDPRILDYAATLAADVDSIILTATAESPAAAIAVDGMPLARNGRLISLEPGAARTVRVEVTAESGAVSRTVIRLSRESARDTNARLARLQLAGAQLVPGFDPRVFEYAARLAANVSAVTLTAMAESPVATIVVDGQPLARTGRLIDLEPGAARTVIVDVRAESGAVARTVIRLSRESAKDANTRLERLQLVGARLAPSFEARVFEYAARLPANVAAVTLTAAAESPVATIEVDGQPLSRTGRLIALEPAEARTVLIDVRAESGAVARTVLRLSREGPVPPVVTPGSDRISVDLRGVKVEKRELAGLSDGRISGGSEARITVRYYRTNTVIVQGTAEVAVKMQGDTPVIASSWTSPGVRLDRDRLVEVEVAIPISGSSWLHYTEAQWADAMVEVDVPFLLLSRTTRVAWPPIGTPVRVIGYIALSPGVPRKSEIPSGGESLELDAKGEYGVQVTIADAATGRILVQDTVWGKPGLPRGHVFAFSKPISLPEGATVKYTLTAKAKNGQGWSASGTAEIWTTRLAYGGGFEPVTLNLGEDLKPLK